MIIVLDEAALAVAAAQWLADAIRAAIGARGRCTVALAGGTSPKAVYAALAGLVNWSKVEIFFGDERAVPPGDPQSNYRVVAETLLSRVRVPPARVHRMEAERPDLEAAATDYARALPERLDVLLLGMGPDGHTASLFPGSPALEEMTRRVVSVLDAPKPPARRLTITPPVIAAARAVAVLATGAEKAAVLARALEGPPAVREVPVQLAARGTWFVDPAAAGLLTVRA